MLTVLEDNAKKFSSFDFLVQDLFQKLNGRLLGCCDTDKELANVSCTQCSKDFHSECLISEFGYLQILQSMFLFALSVRNSKKDKNGNLGVKKKAK